MIEDYYNTLYAVNKFSEGTAPNYSQTFALQDEDKGLFDRDSSTRIWSDQGSNLKISSKFYCSSAVEITEKDRVKIIEDHIIAIPDLTKYHKTAAGSTWTLTTSAAIGEACIFYQATNSAGLGRKADGQEYNIFVKKNPNLMDHHYELMLERVG